LAYEKVSSLHRRLTEEDVMSQVPIHNITEAFRNGTKLELNRSKMKTEFVKNGFILIFQRLWKFH
jgi:hypothetical protein